MFSSFSDHRPGMTKIRLGKDQFRIGFQPVSGQTARHPPKIEGEYPAAGIQVALRGARALGTGQISIPPLSPDLSTKFVSHSRRHLTIGPSPFSAFWEQLKCYRLRLVRLLSLDCDVSLVTAQLPPDGTRGEMEELTA
jgi:hypothetical protein